MLKSDAEGIVGRLQGRPEEERKREQEEQVRKGDPTAVPQCF